MAVIQVNHFAGGAALTAKQGNSQNASLQKILEDIADDFAGLQQPAPAASASAVTAVSDAVVTAVADATGDVGAGALANDLKAKYNAAVDLINDLKAKYNDAVTLLNELRTDAIAAGGHTILTTKA